MLYGSITYEKPIEKPDYLYQIDSMYQELLNEQSNKDMLYTREMIGKMTADEYLEHEPMIMEQLKTALKYFINIFFIMSSGRGYFLWKK